ncbi:MAG TPA: hypothetical protein DEP35_06640 [Deltaproteobacteria bacterium]|jgi:hypothetical protein|nr:hypothetical protein [Deltaproteobacteria bacterium]
MALLRFVHAIFGRLVFRGKKAVTVAIAAGPMLLLGPTSSYTFIRTEVPGASGTGDSAGDNTGQNVSTFIDAPEGLTHGFAKDGSTYATVDLAMNTSVFGINNAVQLAGSTVSDAATGKGFVASPVPEPSAALLVAVGLVGLAIRHHRARGASLVSP